MMLVVLEKECQSVRKNSIDSKRCQKRELAGILPVHLGSESRLLPAELKSQKHFSVVIPMTSVPVLFVCAFWIWTENKSKSFPLGVSS